MNRNCWSWPLQCTSLPTEPRDLMQRSLGEVRSKRKPANNWICLQDKIRHTHFLQTLDWEGWNSTLVAPNRFSKLPVFRIHDVCMVESPSLPWLPYSTQASAIQFTCSAIQNNFFKTLFYVYSKRFLKNLRSGNIVLLKTIFVYWLS